jgi:signal transduction histidine kinase/ligand-binding sensor domain-containing protein
MRLSKKLLYLLFLCLGSYAAPAQYRFDHWTTDNGLPQNTVGSILQTTDGYIWFTTLDGLVRFDGVRFTVFSKSNSKKMPSNRLVKLLAEEDNTLWLVTEESGLVRYRNGEFQTFSSADGLPSDSIFDVAREPGGSILAYTSKGTARFDGNRFSSTMEGTENPDINKLRTYFGASGTHWELTHETLAAVREEKKTEYGFPPELKKIFPPGFNLYTVKMFEDRDGEIWIAIGSSTFKSEGGALKIVTAQEITDGIVSIISQDKRGDIWLGTQNKGACRLSQNRFNCFDVKNGLGSNFVLDIFSDREGTLWIATNEKGLYRLSEQVIVSLSVEQGLVAKNTYPVLEASDGSIWIGTYGGLSRYKDGKFTNYTQADGLNSFYIQSLFEDRSGGLWIGGLLGGLTRLENGKFYDTGKTQKPNVGNARIYGIYQALDGSFWFATGEGLYKFDGAETTRITTEDGLPGNDVKVILESRDGTLWVGTYSGLAELKNGKVTSFTEKDGLAGDHIRSLYEDENGTLWIGTYETGLSRFAGGKFTNYSTSNGLFSNGVFQILPDERGNFWMSSNQGIYRVSREQLDDFAQGRRVAITSTSFGKLDGMLSSECNGGGQPSGIKTRDGRLWFPTQDGVAVIDPEAVPFNPLAPPVVIESSKIDSRPAKIRQSAVEMQPSENNLEIHYTGLSFIKPEQVQFKYKLEGLDETWIEAGTRREAFYPYLPPGEYTFRVIAANSDNIWNNDGASLHITVKPPFYRTWLFIGACLAAVVLTIFTAYRTRIFRLEKARLVQEDFSRRLINIHETERRRIAAELHDSIGQSLAMIKNRAVIGAESVTDKIAREQLDLIGAQTAQTISEVREISYNLRPHLLDQLGLKRSLNSLLNQLEESGQTKIYSEIEEIDNLFGKESELSIYRIIQESLGNIIKHAEASSAEIYVKKGERNLTIIITDDGKGFDLDALNNEGGGRVGFGLFGISERVRMLGGTRQIETAIGSGTTIFIRLPLEDLKDG